MMYYCPKEKGFYLEGSQPEGAKEITEERHRELLDAQLEGAEIVPDANGFPMAKMRVITLEQVKLEKLAEIKRWALSAEKILTDEYTAGEMASWPTQRAEAEALIVDVNALAPLLRGIASERGLDVIDLANKVIDKNNMFAVAASQIYGRRQALVDRVEAANQITDIHKIIVIDNGEP